MTNTQPNSIEHAYNPPVVQDPETGHIEVLGEGRIAIIGEEGVKRLVSLPKTDDMIDALVAEGKLSHSA